MITELYQKFGIPWQQEDLVRNHTLIVNINPEHISFSSQVKLILPVLHV